MKNVALFALLLQIPAANSRIAGRVVTFPGLPAPATLTLRVYGQNGSGALVLKPIPVHVDGTFEINGIAPGEYTVSLANPFSSPGRNFTFRSGDVTGLEIKIPVGVKGQIVLEDGAALTGARVSIVTTTPADATNINRAAPRYMAARGWSDAAGNFVAELFPGENTVKFEELPAGYSVKSVTFGAVDILHNPLKLDIAPTSSIVVTLKKGITAA